MYIYVFQIFEIFRRLRLSHSVKFAMLLKYQTLPLQFIKISCYMLKIAYHILQIISIEYGKSPTVQLIWQTYVYRIKNIFTYLLFRNQWQHTFFVFSRFRSQEYQVNKRVVQVPKHKFIIKLFCQNVSNFFFGFLKKKSLSFPNFLFFSIL